MAFSLTQSDGDLSTCTAVNGLVLNICYPDARTERFALTDKCTIGSGPRCTVRLRESDVHPLHCLIVPGAEATTIRRWAADTLLNGASFDDATLAAGDTLTVGPVEIEVVASDAADQCSEENNDAVGAPMAGDTDAVPSGSVKVEQTSADAVDAEPFATEESSTTASTVSPAAEEVFRQLQAANTQNRQRARQLLFALRNDRSVIRDLEGRVTQLQEQLELLVDELEALTSDTASAEEQTETAADCHDESPSSAEATEVDRARADESEPEATPTGELKHRVADTDYDAGYAARLANRIEEIDELESQLGIGNPGDADEEDSPTAESVDIDADIDPIGPDADAAGAPKFSSDAESFWGFGAASEVDDELLGPLARTANSAPTSTPPTTEESFERSEDSAAEAPMESPTAEAVAASDDAPIADDIDDSAAEAEKSADEPEEAVGEPVGDDTTDDTVAAVEQAPEHDAEPPADELASHLPPAPDELEDEIGPAAESEHSADAGDQLATTPASAETPAEIAEQTEEPSTVDGISAEALAHLRELSIWRDTPSAGATATVSKPAENQTEPSPADAPPPAASPEVKSAAEADVEPTSPTADEFESAAAEVAEPTEQTEPAAGDEPAPSDPTTGLGAESAESGGPTELAESAGAESSLAETSGVEELADAATDEAVEVPATETQSEPEQVPSGAPGESFIDRYSHMFDEDDDEPNEAEATSGEAVLANSLEAEMDQFSTSVEAASGDTDDESLDDYMSQLMQRVRGDEPTATAVAPLPKASAAPKKKESTAADDAINGAAEQPVEAPVNLEDIKRVGPRPEQSTDMNALRELANQTARQAIDTHSSKKRRETTHTSIVVATIAMASGGFLITSAPSLLSLQSVAGAVAVIGALHWGLSVFSSGRKKSS